MKSTALNEGEAIFILQKELPPQDLIKTMRNFWKGTKPRPIVWNICLLKAMPKLAATDKLPRHHTLKHIPSNTQSNSQIRSRSPQ